MVLFTKMKFRLFLVFALALAFAPRAARAAHGELQRTINAQSNALKAEITFATDFHIKTFTLNNPPRFVVDMEPALLPDGGTPGGTTFKVDSRGIKSIRMAQNSRNPDRVRMVFDLKTADTVLTLAKDPGKPRLVITEPGADASRHKPAVSNPKISKSAKTTTLTFDVSAKDTGVSIKERAGEGFGQVLEITFPGYSKGPSGMDISAGVVSALEWTETADAAVARIKSRVPVAFKMDKSGGQAVLRLEQPAMSTTHICVDPGHGGKDSGTVGFDGTTEKEIVLDISLRLRDMLQASGARVTITRNSDYYLTLGARVDVANNSGCQYFVSIHGNALPDHDRKPDRRGAQSYHYGESSKDFADTMLKEMVFMMGVGDMGMYERKFYVIRNTNMKAVLVEIAFLSQRDDLALLKTPEFRENAARSLYNGLESYMGMHGARMKPVALPAAVAKLVPRTPYYINSAGEARFAEMPSDLKELPNEAVPAVVATSSPAPSMTVVSLPSNDNASSEPEVLVVTRSLPAELHEKQGPAGAYKPRLRQVGAIYPKEPWNFKRDYAGPMSRAPR
jgi:N-acetylmuramoyl-L-alanine amidase